MAENYIDKIKKNDVEYDIHSSNSTSEYIILPEYIIVDGEEHDLTDIIDVVFETLFKKGKLKFGLYLLNLSFAAVDNADKITYLTFGQYNSSYSTCMSVEIDIDRNENKYIIQVSEI